MMEAPRLRILQQNVNKSNVAQLDLLNSTNPNDFDVIAIQEPYIDHLKNTRATPHWRVVYPSVRDPDTAPRARSILLINKKLSTNAWSPIRIPHPDITAITITTGPDRIHLFNLYVDGDHDTAIHAATRATRRLAIDPNSERAQHLLWLGDFN